MAGYFDGLLDSYAPAVVASDSPWPAAGIDPPEIDEPLSDETLPDAPGPEPTASETPPVAGAEPGATIAAPLHAPMSGAVGEEPTDPPAPQPPGERVIERETRVIEHGDGISLPPPAAPPPGIETSDRPAAEARDAPAPPVEIHRREEIHLVEELAPDFVPEAESPEPPDPPEPPDVPASEGVDFDARLAAMGEDLTRALARFGALDRAPPNVIEAEDFEPERDHAPLPPDPEVMREVTREVVTEIHHHHHETRVEPRGEPAAATVPLTAAEASRIGPIRFSSTWKTGGR